MKQTDTKITLPTERKITNNLTPQYDQDIQDWLEVLFATDAKYLLQWIKTGLQRDIKWTIKIEGPPGVGKTLLLNAISLCFVPVTIQGGVKGVGGRMSFDINMHVRTVAIEAVKKINEVPPAIRDSLSCHPMAKLNYVPNKIAQHLLAVCL